MSWQAGFTAYGAALDRDGRIVRNGVIHGVRAVVKGRRLRFERMDGSLLMSGPVSPETVERFVESFWFWRKQA
jgi:hypothetical protein